MELLRVRSAHDFETTLAKARACLASEGFGVLTHIDMQATMKKKLDADMARYEILGACSPSHAYRAVQAQPEIGVMLPCNVVVRELDDGVEVMAFDPMMMAGDMAHADVHEVATDVHARLIRVLDGLT